MSTNIETESLLKRSEVARILGVNVVTVLRWTLRGDLPCLRFNSRMIRYRKEDVEGFIGSKSALAKEKVSEQ